MKKSKKNKKNAAANQNYKGMRVFSAALLVTLMMPAAPIAALAEGASAAGTADSTPAQTQSVDTAKTTATTSTDSATTASTATGADGASAASTGATQGSAASANTTNGTTATDAKQGASAATGSSTTASTAQASTTSPLSNAADTTAAQAVADLYDHNIHYKFGTSGVGCFYKDVQSVYDAYNKLTNEQKTLLDTSMVDSLMKYHEMFNYTYTTNDYTVTTKYNILIFYFIQDASGDTVTRVLPYNYEGTPAVADMTLTILPTAHFDSEGFLVANLVQAPLGLAEPGDHMEFHLNVVNGTSSQVDYSGYSLNLAPVIRTSSGKELSTGDEQYFYQNIGVDDTAVNTGLVKGSDGKYHGVDYVATGIDAYDIADSASSAAIAFSNNLAQSIGTMAGNAKSALSNIFVGLSGPNIGNKYQGITAGFDFALIFKTAAPTPDPIPVTPTVTPATPTVTPVTPTTTTPAVGTPIVAEATPVAAPAEEVIAADETPLGAFDDGIWCWVHPWIILGIVLSSVYFCGVIIRRSNNIRKLRNLGDEAEEQRETAEAGSLA